MGKTQLWMRINAMTVAATELARVQARWDRHEIPRESLLEAATVYEFAVRQLEEYVEGTVK